MKHCLTTMLAISLMLSGSNGSQSGRNEKVFKGYGFPSRSGLTHLCGQRVYGSGHELVWDAFASRSTPAELVEYYRRKLGDEGFEKENEGGIWRLPAGASRPSRVLEVMIPSADAPFRSCEKSPPANSKSVLMISRMI